MSVLLDTNVFVDYLRGLPAAIAYIEGLAAQPATSVITVAELAAGAPSQREEKRIEALLVRTTILAATTDIARRAGTLKRLYSGSHGVGLADALIAATAEQHGLKLATLNVRHFPMFPRLKPAY